MKIFRSGQHLVADILESGSFEKLVKVIEKEMDTNVEKCVSVDDIMIVFRKRSEYIRFVLGRGIRSPFDVRKMVHVITERNK